MTIQQYGPVLREQCACLGVIITASNASPERVVEALERHVRTLEHRVWSEARALDYDTSPEAPLAYPAASVAVTPADSRTSAEVDARTFVSHVPSGGASIHVRPDGYDFTLPQQRRNDHE